MKNGFRFCLLAAMCLFITACNSDDAVTVTNTETTITGTAAAGAPIVGTINVRGANGNTSFSPILSDGSYTVDVSSLVAPFLVWAEGRANGQFVRLYSTVEEAGGVANVTPASNLVMTMALGADPAEVYGAYGEDILSAALPDATEIVQAAADVNALLASVFARLDMPADFDLMNGQFVADGSAFDSVLDTVSFQVDASDPDNINVMIQNKSTQEKLYKENVTTKVVEVELTPAEIDGIVGAGLTFQQEALALFNKLENLYATTKPTLEQLQTEFQPWMATDYLDNGLNVTDQIADFSSLNDNGPDVGFLIESVSIYRAMTEQNFDGVTLDEKPNYFEGNWMIVTGTDSGESFTMLTSFVRDADGVVKWYGNRNPFMEGGDVEARHTREIQQDGSIDMWSGLGFWTNDLGNVASANYSIDSVVVLHSSMPALDSLPNLKGLLLSREAAPNTSYSIVFPQSNSAAHWNMIYTEADGLDITKVNNNDEFVFVGIDSANGPQHTWIDVLSTKPLPSSSLTTGQFAEITAPISAADVNIPGDVTVEWNLPTTGTVVDGWGDIWWSNGTSSTHMGVGKPNTTAPWTSTTFDTSATGVTNPLYFGVSITVETEGFLEFRTSINNISFP